MKEKFIDFLKKENAFDSYVTNFNERIIKGGMLEWLNVEDPEGYIAEAFIWANTYEGWEYWNNLDEQWLKIIQNEKLHN